MSLIRSKIARVAGLTAIAILVPIAAAGEDSNGVFPDDPLFPQQWTLHNTGQFGGTPGADINAPQAWEITTGDSNIVIAVLDSGVDRTHPDLIDNLVPGYDFVDDDDNPDPAAGDPHGTACAGVAAAKGNNGIGLAGVAYDCKIMPVRTRSGTVIVSAAQDATALRWAAAHGADVINYSWPRDDNSALFKSAVEDVTRIGGIGRAGRGCVVCFAAGNTSGRMGPSRTIPQVIMVGATDNHDVRWSWSSYGPELDLVAPTGWTSTTTCWTTDLVGPAGFSSQDYYQYMGGTSGSCPVVAGVAALILSIEPGLTSDEVRHFLERSAKDLGDPGSDDYYGWGRVDARAALDMVLAKRADLNNDWKVDLEDLLILIEFWGTAEPSADIAPAARRDGIVDVQDLELMMEHWQEQILEPGLVARWKLDETEGSVAQNSVSDNDGILHGDPLWQPAGGRKAGALQFDGIDDYVSTAFVLNPAGGAFSVFAWIQGAVPGDAVISQTDGIIAGNGETWLGTEPSSGKFMSGLVPPAVGRFIPQPLKSESVITDGQWHHIGFVWDGSYRSLYVDGAEVAKDATAQAPLKSATGGLYIGAGKTLDAASFFSGLINEVRIYDVTLSADRVKALAR